MGSLKTLLYNSDKIVLIFTHLKLKKNVFTHATLDDDSVEYSSTQPMNINNP